MGQRGNLVASLTLSCSQLYQRKYCMPWALHQILTWMCHYLKHCPWSPNRSAHSRISSKIKQTWQRVYLWCDPHLIKDMEKSFCEMLSRMSSRYMVECDQICTKLQDILWAFSRLDGGGFTVLYTPPPSPPESSGLDRTPEMSHIVTWWFRRSPLE